MTDTIQVNKLDRQEKKYKGTDLEHTVKVAKGTDIKAAGARAYLDLADVVLEEEPKRKKGNGKDN